MASIMVYCPQCNTTLTVTPKGAGVIKGKCPKCKADLEMTMPAPSEAPSSEASEPARPPIRRPSSDVAGKTVATRWLVAGGGAIALVGIMLISCVGLGIWGYLASRDKGPGQDVLAVAPKEDPAGKVANGGDEQRERGQTPSRDKLGNGGDEQPPRKDLGAEKPPTRKDDPPEEPVEVKKKPLPKQKEMVRENLIPPIDLGNLQKSDRLIFDLAPIVANEAPPPEIWDGHTNHISGVSFTDDGKYVVSVSGDVDIVKENGRQRAADYSIRVWDARRGKQVHKLTGFKEGLKGLSVSPGGRFAVFGFGGQWRGEKYIDAKDTHVRMIDIQNNREIPFDAGLMGQGLDRPIGEGKPRFQGLDSSVFCSSFSQSRQTIVAGANNGRLVCWRAESGLAFVNTKIPVTREAPLAPLADWPLGIYCSQCTPDGRYLVLASSCSLWVFNLHAPAAAPVILSSHRDLVASLATTAAPDGRSLAISGGGSQFRRDGKGFVDGAKDYAVRLWDLKACAVLRQFPGHQHDVTGLAFRPGTRHFLSGSLDKTVRLWDWETGRLLRTYKGHTQSIQTVAISPDGRSAVSAGHDCVIRYWQLPTLAEDLIAALEENDAPKLEKAIEDMDIMGPDLKAGFGPLAKALSQNDPAMRPLIRKSLLIYADLWRKNQLVRFDRSDVGSLVTILKTSDTDLQSFALEAAIGLGPQAEQAVSSLLSIAGANGDSKVLAQALFALKRIGANNEEALTAYQKHLNHSDIHVKDSAALALLHLGPDRLPIKRVIELVDTSNKSVAVAAVHALRKLDPANSVLKTKAFTLLIEDLNPEMSDLNRFLAKPLAGKSAAAVLELGEPAIAPLIKHLLSRNDPRKGPENCQVEPTAARYLGYELLKEFAKQAKATGDKKMTLALKKQELNLKAVWAPDEAKMAKQVAGMAAETRQVYVKTAEAADQAYRAVSALRNP